jgi:hypothetical protein
MGRALLQRTASACCSISSTSCSGNTPKNVIQPIAGGALSNLVVYPSDRPKYFMQFDIHEYTRQRLQEVGRLGPALQTVALPLSSNLVDITSQEWKDTPIGVGGWA